MFRYCVKFDSVNSNGGHLAAEVIFCTCFYMTLTFYRVKFKRKAPTFGAFLA